MRQPTSAQLSDKALAFIGTGTMAEAMIQILLDKGRATPSHIWASDVPARNGPGIYTAATAS